MSTLNFDGISFPVKIDQIKKFEKQNEEISINVQHVGPGRNLLSLYASEYRGRKHHINLLLLNESYSVDPEGNETVWGGISEIPNDHTVIHRSHYTLVKNLSALVSARTNRQKKVHACQYCLRCFSGEHVLQNHLAACSKHKPCAIKFPSKFIKKRKDMNEEDENLETLEEALGIDADIAAENATKNIKYPPNIMHFKNHQHTMPVPFCIYADFESFIGEGDEHQVSGFCCLTVSSFDFLNNEEAIVYSGENVIQTFFQHIQKEHNRINSILSQCNPMDNLSEEEQLIYDAATRCNTCDKIFSERNAKIRHHDHLTGKFIAATCNTCNLKLKPRMSSKTTPSDYQLKVQALENYKNQLQKIEEEQDLES